MLRSYLVGEDRGRLVLVLHGERQHMGWEREAPVRCKGNKATGRVAAHWRGHKICLQRYVKLGWAAPCIS